MQSKPEYKTYMTNKTEIKKFIRNFNFPDPKWDNLPQGFPNLNKDGLSLEEGYLFDAIKTAWIIEGGRKTFYRAFAKKTLLGVAAAALILLGGSLVTAGKNALTTSVSAKTITQSFGEILESTMSAIIRR